MRRVARILPAVALLPVLAALTVSAADPGKDYAVMSEEITIKGKKMPGVVVQPPPVKLEKPVIDEVLKSLKLYNADYRAGAPQIGVEGGPKRLAQPFPEPPYLVFSPKSFEHPYERWRFEVFAGDRLVWSTEGASRLQESLTWSGTDGRGKMVARVGPAYYFRFIAVTAEGDEISVVSNPVRLSSMLYHEDMGNVRLEVGNAVLFAAGRSAIMESALEHLKVMATYLRRLHAPNEPYRIALYQPESGYSLARDRAASLKRFFSKALLVNESKILVTLMSAADRGDVTACILPPESGALIGGG